MSIKKRTLQGRVLFAIVFEKQLLTNLVEVRGERSAACGVSTCDCGCKGSFARSTRRCRLDGNCPVFTGSAIIQVCLVGCAPTSNSSSAQCSSICIGIFAIIRISKVRSARTELVSVCSTRATVTNDNPVTNSHCFGNVCLLQLHVGLRLLPWGLRKIY